MTAELTEWIKTFDSARPQLEGLAYRILGSVVEAEDAVQDTFIKWQAADRAVIEHPQAWLTTVCTRQALDMLKAAHKKRVSYVGTWLPEPLHTIEQATAEDSLEIASNLSTAFLLLLERLTPKERAAYLLFDVFATDYSEIAAMLRMEEPAVRKLVSRARRHISEGKVRYRPAAQDQQRFLSAFQDAVKTGNTGRLAGLLSDDVELRADGGGKAITISKTLSDKRHILKFIRTVLSPAWDGSVARIMDLNEQKSLVFSKKGTLHTVVSFACDAEGKVTDLYLMRNPEKLELLMKVMENCHKSSATTCS